MTTINSFPLTTVAASTILPPVQWTYSSTTTDADPGDGKLRLNNATPASATAAYIDNEEIGGTDVSDWLDTFDDGGNSTKRGTLKVYSSASPSVFHIYTISGSVTDGTGYRKLTIAHVAGTGSFTDATAVTLVFIPNFAPEALTKTDDTNVTLTLGGTPSTALVNAASITAGWTGQLSVARGGTGSSTASAARTALGLVIGTDVQAFDADTLKADTADVLTAGFATTTFDAGTKSSGTFTPDEANGNFQKAVNGGAHTLAPPTNECNLVLQYTNGASAGAVTTSGFTKVTGDTISTTSGDDFLFYITKINSFSHLNVVALQ